MSAFCMDHPYMFTVAYDEHQKEVDRMINPVLRTATVMPPKLVALRDTFRGILSFYGSSVIFWRTDTRYRHGS